LGRTFSIFSIILQDFSGLSKKAAPARPLPRGAGLIFPGRQPMVPRAPPPAVSHYHITSWQIHRILNAARSYEKIFMPRGAIAMNKWLLGAILAAMALFMYFAIIVKMT
jgi:hypothetical protein